MTRYTPVCALALFALPATAVAGATVEHFNDYYAYDCFEPFPGYEQCTEVSRSLHALSTPSGNYTLIIDLVTVDVLYDGDGVEVDRVTFSEKGNGLDKGDGWFQIHDAYCVEFAGGYSYSVVFQLANGETVFERFEDGCD